LTRRSRGYATIKVYKLIRSVKKHPDAESLYVETIDIGEATGPRIVCSGLVKYMSEDDIRDKSVIVIVSAHGQARRVADV
jgi:aminoacyl tRNA synthase complex-interacting multifunctional protein 1